MSILYRDGRPDDVAYIVSCWRKCLLEGVEPSRTCECATCRHSKVDETLLYRGFTDRITRLLQRSTVRMACDPEQDTNLIGFAIFEGNVGHFRYVRGGKNGFRGQGIAKKLIEGHDILVCTHRAYGHAVGKMRQTFNPFLLESA